MSDSKKGVGWSFRPVVCVGLDKCFCLVSHFTLLTMSVPPTEPHPDKEQKVTPWTATSEDEKGIDYDKLIRQFGSDRITESIIERLERLTGKPAHPWLRRGYFFSHRCVTSRYENNI